MTALALVETTVRPPRRSPALVEVAPAGYGRRSRTDRLADLAELAGFFGRLAIKEHLAPRLHVRPLVAELFLTENCNLKCISCGCWTSTTRDELRTEEWCDVIDQLAALGIRKVNFTGGEPLIRRDAVGLMAHAARAGIRELHLNTNGIRLDAPTLDRVLGAGVRSFNISVDGPDAATHDAVRGVDGAFDTTMAHLRAVVARRDALGLRVRMNFTVMRSNAHHLPAMARLAEQLGVRLYLNLASDSTFLFRHPDVATETRPDDAVLRDAVGAVRAQARTARRWLPGPTDLDYVVDHFTDRLQRDVPCAESQLKLMVHSRGEVGGCWGHDPHDDVRTRSISSVVSGEAYREEHARFYRKDCVGCGSNYSLNLRWRPRRIVRDATWRLRDRALPGRDR